MNINYRIKKLRIILNMNQTEFAKKLGVTQPSLSDIEKGKTLNIDERNIKIMCTVFNVNEDWLRTGEGEMFKSEGDFIDLVISSLDNLDEMDKKFISTYIKLNPKHKEIFKKFIRELNN